MENLQQFFNLPTIDRVNDDGITIYGYAECMWCDANPRTWKCFRGPFTMLKERYLNSIDREEMRSNRIPDDQYDENVLFKGTAFFVLEDGSPIEVIMSVAELHQNMIIRDLSYIAGNCPPFAWNI